MALKPRFGLLSDGSLGWKNEHVELSLPPLPRKPDFEELLIPAELSGRVETAFDWWQVSFEYAGWFPDWDSVSGEPVEPMAYFIELVGRHYPHADWVRQPAKNGYEVSLVLAVGESRIMAVSWGGSHDLANVVVSGSRSNDVRAYLVSILPPSCRVSRVDSAFDSRGGSEAFERVTAWAIARASEAGINCTWIRNTDKSKGDTLYIGSKTSRVQVRIYEKGKQVGYLPDEWFRVEVQFRPRSDEKKSVYKWSSGMIWSVSHFCRDLGSYLMNANLVANALNFVQRDKDLDHRLLMLATQYRALIAQAISVHGSPAAVVDRMDVLLSSVDKSTISSLVAPVPQCPF